MIEAKAEVVALIEKKLNDIKEAALTATEPSQPQPQQPDLRTSLLEAIKPKSKSNLILNGRKSLLVTDELVLRLKATEMARDLVFPQ